MKFINSIEISKADVIASGGQRTFTINGDKGAFFNLEITNAAGEFYNFITSSFTTNRVYKTTGTVGVDTTNSVVYLTASNANIKIGMVVTGNGISEHVIVTTIDSETITLDKNVDITSGTTLTFSAESGLNSKEITSTSYTDSIVFPSISTNDTYNIILEASIINDTNLRTTEIVYDEDPDSATYGDDITEGFTNILFKSIEIKQYVNTTITINASSSALDTLGVDYSGNTFTIVKPRNFTKANGFKTSFSWTFTTTSDSYIAKSQDVLDTYFEVTKTQTVNGAVSSSRTIVLDSVDNVVPGMFATGTGLASGNGDTVLAVDIDNKKITINNARTVSDGVTITFTGKGSVGPKAFNTNLSFTNLTATLTPLTVAVATASSNSTTLALEDASFILADSTIIIKGPGIDVDETPTSIVGRQQTFNLTCAHNNDPTITHSADERIVAGLAVSGTGIPAGATIASITSATEFELSASTTGGNVAAGTLTFNSNNVTLSAAKTVEAGQTLTLENTSNAVTITGDVILNNMGDTNFTSTLQLDNVVGIGLIAT